MPIYSKLGEQDITDAILYILLETGGNINTTEVKSYVRNLLEPAGVNSTPLLNRNDEVIDQIIRNIVSHRDNPSNIINKGYISYVNGLWNITSLGKDYLNNRMKIRFSLELN
ncbi:MAG: hypothetical protein SOY42_02550 [Clostridium sp.]|nr:hypothetical protein [Clostridium sp.]